MLNDAGADRAGVMSRVLVCRPSLEKKKRKTKRPSTTSRARRLPNSPLIDTYLVPEAPQDA
eukprot:1892217-Prymnesium_polylepis.1